MSPTQPPSPWLPVLHARNCLFNAIRHFFDQLDYLEVDTPYRIQAPALEDHIDAEPSGDWYLRASPELHMKRLLASGFNRIYQLGPCFRKGEMGPRHLPEFKMLEWYRTNADCYDILKETMDLIQYCASSVAHSNTIVYQNQTVKLDGEWEVMSVDDAFTKYADTNKTVDQLLENNEFEMVLVDAVQPQLGRNRPTVICDFPDGLSSLAKRHPEKPRRVERWELFIAGMEIANAYTELTDYEDQIKRFEDSRKLRQATGRDIYPVDQHYLKALKQGFPDCGGIAFGIDRFLMLLVDKPTIQEVVPFANDR